MAIDLRTPEERLGLSKSQALAKSLSGILETLGQGERVRRERQQLDRIATAIANGATTVKAIAAAANQPTEFAPGIRGGAQRLAGAFSQPGGGVGDQINQSIISAELRRALQPKGSTGTPEGLELSGQRRDEFGNITSTSFSRPFVSAKDTPAGKVKDKRTQRDKDLTLIGRKTVSRFRKNEARKRLDANDAQPKTPFPQDFDFSEILSSDDKVDGKFGEKAYRNGLDRVKDGARQGGIDPKQAEEAFNKFWDARVKNETTGLFGGAFTRNVTLSRSEFQEGNVGRTGEGTETGGNEQSEAAQKAFSELDKALSEIDLTALAKIEPEAIEEALAAIIGGASVEEVAEQIRQGDLDPETSPGDLDALIKALGGK